jgi:hypothetical protein
MNGIQIEAYAVILCPIAGRADAVYLLIVLPSNNNGYEVRMSLNVHSAIFTDIHCIKTLALISWGTLKLLPCILLPEGIGFS